MHKKIFVLSFFLILSLAVNAQNSSLQREYNNGKDLFNLEKYALAMEALRPLTRQDDGNPYVEYASFYYALAAKKEGREAVARDMFLQIAQKYPKWNKLDEVYYWLGEIYLSEGEYDKGIKALSKIKNKEVKEDALAMEIHFLSQTNDFESLKDLLQQNPYDAGVARVLAKKIAEKPATPENKQLFEFLMSEFNLDANEYDMAKMRPSQKKDSYNVAVFFPFMLNDLESEKKVYPNQFVLDTYAGIKLAVDQLNTEGINIQLHAYDTQKDSATTAELLSRKEIRNMDLIVGPLYPASSKLVSDYTYRYKINMVNPLSSNSEVMGGNPMSFLYKPSLESQARAAAIYASEVFNDNPNAMIVYGITPKDSVLAFNYKKTAEENGLQIVRMEKVGTSRARQLLNLLTKPEDEKDSTDVELGHIFMATSEELVVANAISALEIRGDKLPVIAFEDWLELKFVSFEQLERLGLRFIAPGFIDYENEDVVEFRKKYIEENNSVPSLYAYSGYDMMLFFGRQMHEHGNYFQEGFTQADFKKGTIYPGYLYYNSNDNQYVPIIQFQEAILEVQNNR